MTMDSWKSGDKFEVKVEDRAYLFDFGRANSGVFIASCDEAGITVEGKDLAECREIAREAVELLLEDMRDDGEI